MLCLVPFRDSWSSPPFPGGLSSPDLSWWWGVTGLGPPDWGGQRDSGGQPSSEPPHFTPSSPAVCCILSKAAGRRGSGSIQPETAPPPRHGWLLERNRLCDGGGGLQHPRPVGGAHSGGLTGHRGEGWGVGLGLLFPMPAQLPFLEGLPGSSSSFIFGIQSLLLPEMGSFDPHFLVFAPNFVLPACPALMNSTTTIYPAL